MNTLRFLLATALALSVAGPVMAQRPNIPYFGVAPGMQQMRAVETRRHQARTQLYREALEELRRNPAAADVAPCANGGDSADRLCVPPPAVAATEPAKPAAAPAAKPAVAEAAPAARRHVALLIGNNRYPDPIPELETPISDVRKMGEVLRIRFGYDVRIIEDGRKSEIVTALNRIGQEVDVDDSVLLFYAGHGYLMDDTGMGYWIPVDGSNRTAANWISNSDIAKFLHAIPARQVILVSDSCFSGTLTREQKVDTRSAFRKDVVLRQRSVLVLSSGGEEPVSDEGKGGHSIFAWHLLEALGNTRDATPGYDIYRVVREQVRKEYEQDPQYGAALSAGHVPGGEYLFEPRQ